jgi:hypothetical protein
VHDVTLRGSCRERLLMCAGSQQPYLPSTLSSAGMIPPMMSSILFRADAEAEVVKPVEQPAAGQMLQQRGAGQVQIQRGRVGEHVKQVLFRERLVSAGDARHRVVHRTAHRMIDGMQCVPFTPGKLLAYQAEQVGSTCRQLLELSASRCRLDLP